jgi:uncharacterized protein YoxC
MIAGLIYLLIALAVVCLVIYIVEALLPVDGTIKRIIEVIILLIFLLYLLRWAGLF